MSVSHGVSLAMACALLFQATTPAVVFAQDQGGGISGIVRDSSQAVVPDVVVEARSPSMPGVATVVSDRNGIYRFPSLLPGMYQLSAEKAGFTPGKIMGIALTLGAEFHIDVTLRPAGLTQSVVVTAEPPIIDVRQHAATYSVDQHAIRLLPTDGRDFTDVLSMAAGVQAARHGLSIDGSTGPENHYVVNGVTTNDTITGVSAQPVRLDFIEELQVVSSGYSAEHAAAMGGVVNVVTKSGGDQFHGSVGTYFFDPNFRWNGSYRAETRISPIDNRTPEVFVGRTNANTRSPDYEWLGEVGGPIRTKQIWFYVSNSSTYQPSERTVLFSRAPQNGPTTFTSYASSVRQGYTVTAAATPTLRTRLTGQFDHVRTRRSLPGQMEPDGYTTLVNPATRFDLTGEDLPSRLLSASLDYAATPRLFLSARLGYRFSDQYDVDTSYSPELRHTFRRSNIGLAGVSPALQFPLGYTSTPLTNVGRARAQSTRLAWDLSATHFASWKGQHAIKSGLSAEWVVDDVLSGNTAPNIFLYWDATFTSPDNRTVRGPFGYYGVQQTGTFGKVTETVVGVFVQDSWQPNDRLAINVGIRTDRESVPGYNSGPGLRFGFGDKLAPRLGLAWDVTGNAHWKVYSSYGRFFDTTKLRVARAYFGGEVLRWDYYSLDTPDWPTVTCRHVGPHPTNDCPGEYDGYEASAAANDPGATRVEPGLKASQTTEFALGLDHALSSRTSVGARYVRKSLDQLVEDVGISQVTATSSTIVYKICNPGIGICENTMEGQRLPDGRPYPPQPRATRDYDALELRLMRRLRDGLYINGSYTWSHLRGNISGLGNEDGSNLAVQPNMTSAFDTPFISYDGRGNAVVGRLAHDRPHAFKLQGAYAFRWGTSVALNYLAQSGAVESTTIFQRGRNAFVNGRGDLGRLATFSQTDLRLQHDVRFVGSHTLNVAMDVSNLFDQKAVVDIGNSPYRDPFSIPDGAYFSPTGLDLAAYVAAIRASANDPQGLNTLRSDPFYGQPQGSAAYQSRRTIQFSARYRF